MRGSDGSGKQSSVKKSATMMTIPLRAWPVTMTTVDRC